MEWRGDMLRSYAYRCDGTSRQENKRLVNAFGTHSQGVLLHTDL